MVVEVDADSVEARLQLDAAQRRGAHLYAVGLHRGPLGVGGHAEEAWRRRRRQLLELLAQPQLLLLLEVHLELERRVALGLDHHGVGADHQDLLRHVAWRELSAPDLNDRGAWLHRDGQGARALGRRRLVQSLVDRHLFATLHFDRLLHRREARELEPYRVRTTRQGERAWRGPHQRPVHEDRRAGRLGDHFELALGRRDPGELDLRLALPPCLHLGASRCVLVARQPGQEVDGTGGQRQGEWGSAHLSAPHEDRRSRRARPDLELPLGGRCLLETKTHDQVIRAVHDELLLRGHVAGEGEPHVVVAQGDPGLVDGGRPHRAPVHRHQRPRRRGTNADGPVRRLERHGHRVVLAGLHLRCQGGWVVISELHDELVRAGVQLHLLQRRDADLALTHVDVGARRRAADRQRAGGRPRRWRRGRRSHRGRLRRSDRRQGGSWRAAEVQ